jgi:ATP-binding cassette subfamily B protein
MQMTAARSRRKNGTQGDNGNRRSLGRAMRYISRYPKIALIATVALLVATAAQLAVPQLVQNILDTITGSAANKFILDLPPNVQETAAEQLGLDLWPFRLT